MRLKDDTLERRTTRIVCMFIGLFQQHVLRKLMRTFMITCKMLSRKILRFNGFLCQDCVFVSSGDLEVA